MWRVVYEYKKPKMFAKDQKINHKAVSKKLYVIVKAQGNKKALSSPKWFNLNKAVDATLLNNITCAS